MVNDVDKKSIVISQAEISALKKLIMYVKFSCKEEESLIFSGSEAINSLFDKVIDVDYLGDNEKIFYNKRNLRNEEFILDKIKRQKMETPNKSSNNVMEDYFNACLHPFHK